MEQTREFRIGVLAGGGGTTVEATELAIRAGLLPNTTIACIISNNGPNNPEAGVWQRAGKLDIPVFHVSNKTQISCTLPVGRDDSPIKGTVSYEASERMVEIAQQHDIDMFVAMGFMRRLIGTVLEQVPVANIHHGPLPATAGKHGIGIDEEALRQGLSHSGPTLHWMDKRLDEFGIPQYDTGPIIDHEPVPITEEMRREWRKYGTATLLQQEDMRVEKEFMPRFIMRAEEQL